MLAIWWHIYHPGDTKVITTVFKGEKKKPAAFKILYIFLTATCVENQKSILLKTDVHYAALKG